MGPLVRFLPTWTLIAEWGYVAMHRAATLHRTLVRPRVSPDLQVQDSLEDWCSQRADIAASKVPKREVAIKTSVERVVVAWKMARTTAQIRQVPLPTSTPAGDKEGRDHATVRLPSIFFFWPKIFILRADGPA